MQGGGKVVKTLGSRQTATAKSAKITATLKIRRQAKEKRGDDIRFLGVSNGRTKTALKSLGKATQEKRRPTLKRLENQAALTWGGSV
jgi:hypothetical protein